MNRLDTYFVSKSKAGTTAAINDGEDIESNIASTSSTTANQGRMQQPQIDVAIHKLSSYTPGMLYYLNNTSYFI